MKKIILSIVITLISLFAFAQVNVPRKLANYEAANWKVWLLDKSHSITIDAPPATTQSKAELQLVKQGISRLDDKKLSAIKYWDAGAPAYRWNQIASHV